MTSDPYDQDQQYVGQPQTKPGWATTEFWITLGAAVAAFMASTESFNLIDISSEQVRSIFAIASVLVPMFYAKQRTDLKTSKHGR